MRIGIDISSLQNNSRNRGIGAYTRSIVKNILSIDRDNEYVFFISYNKPLPCLLKEDIFRKVKIKKATFQMRPFSWLSGQVFCPRMIKEEKLDIFHSPEYMVPIFSASKKMITVHDFINNDFEIYAGKNNFIRKLYIYSREVTLKYADKIIAVSEYTKKKIIELIGIEENKIKVIYETADDIFQPREDKNLFLKLKSKYNIKEDFLLYVGSIDYHKNIHGLLNAFNRLAFRNIGLVMLFPGVDRKYLANINNLIEQMQFKDRVYMLGYVPQEELAAFYNMAKIVMLVSFYEGFGLPVLEAMSCARPVIASGNTSMREIIDSCGILVDPYNIDDISAAIDSLLFDEGLRNILSDKGYQRSKIFNSRKTAEEIIRLYEELSDN